MMLFILYKFILLFFQITILSFDFLQWLLTIASCWMYIYWVLIASGTEQLYTHIHMCVHLFLIKYLQRRKSSGRMEISKKSCCVWQIFSARKNGIFLKSKHFSSDPCIENRLNRLFTCDIFKMKQSYLWFRITSVNIYICKTKRRNNTWNVCGTKEEAKSIISSLIKLLRDFVCLCVCVCVCVYFVLFNENNQTQKEISFWFEHTALFPWFGKLTIDYSASAVRLLTLHLFTSLQIFSFRAFTAP